MSRELDEIKATAGPYQRYALEARRRFLRALAKSDRQITKLYNDAILRILSQFKQGGARSTEALLVAINDDFDQQTLFRGLTDALENAISTGATEGISFTKDITLDVLREAGFATEPMIRAFEFARQRAVAAAYARTYKDGLHLSDRIWNTTKSTRDTMRDIVTAGVGEDAVKVARALETYVNKGAAVTSAHFPGMMKRMGARVPTNLDYNALRLARTELTAAYGEATIAACKASPAVKRVRWVLSNTHPRADICDAYANGGDGHGYYDAKDCPLSPAHPNCLCTIQPAPEDPVALAKHLRAWASDPASQPDIEKWYGKNYKRFEKSGGDLFTRNGKTLFQSPVKTEEKTLGNLRDRYKILPTMTASEREATVKAAGKEFLDDLKKETAYADRKYSLITLKHKKEDFEREVLKRDRRIGHLLSMDRTIFEKYYQKEYEKLSEEEDEWFKKLEDARAKYENLHYSMKRENAKTLAAHLGKIREVGVDETELANHFTTRKSKSRNAVEEAYRYYPRDWTDMSFARGKLTTKMVDRGFYADLRRLLAISGYTEDSRFETAVHELGHRMERTLPDLIQIEKAFYDRRTKGYELEWLGEGYDEDETARRDKFLDMYMGKDYGGYAYELVSMGFELAYTDLPKLMKDEDMCEWILGILAIL